jgi:hypothetical protein
MVPRTTSEDANAPIVMIDADPSSPEHGRVIPLETQWRGSVGLLTVRPVLGESLRARTRYAVALTSALVAEDGSPLAASNAFLAARDTTDMGDPAVVRARTILEPAIEELATAGVERARIVSLAVFTTSDPAVRTLALRDAVHAAPAPVASVDVVYPTASMSLDELLGVPAAAGFGLDLPEVGGAAGERGFPTPRRARSSSAGSRRRASSREAAPTSASSCTMPRGGRP